MTDINIAPINPLPPAVWLLALPIIAVEVVLSMADNQMIGGPQGLGWRSYITQNLAYSPDYLRQMLTVGQYPLNGLWRPFAYPFINGSASQNLFVVVILMAIGKFVGQVFASWAIILVFFASAAAGAIAYTAIPGTHAALIGGFPGVYGLIGAFSFLLWMQLAGTGFNRLQAFRLIGFLLGIRVLFGSVTLYYYGADQGAGWQWVAELGGFACGFLMSFVVSPGGWHRVLAKLRVA